LLDVNFGGAAALFSIARGAADPPLNAIAAPRNLRDARAGRSRVVS
jgi:hypothetical protein